MVKRDICLMDLALAGVDLGTYGGAGKIHHTNVKNHPRKRPNPSQRVPDPLDKLSHYTKSGPPRKYQEPPQLEQDPPDSNQELDLGAYWSWILSSVSWILRWLG